MILLTGFFSSGEFSFTSDTVLSALSSKQTFDQKKAQENGCSIEVICDDDEEAAYSPEQDYGLSPLSSSPCSEGTRKLWACVFLFS